ncbi:MAG: hypothetical protein U5L96_21820 [Owenweeksia sp.]|nr:hypothetical protein [Owenweeksia sp.]
MTTKNPFDYKGLSASVKVGERALSETAVRYAEAFKIGEDQEFENLAFKINLYYLRANDWEATNYEPVFQSEVAANNPGGYDAINIYGDEDFGSGANNFANVNSVLDVPSYAGLGIFYRPGYKEEDIVDYDTRNLKSNLGVYYKLEPNTTLSYNINYGAGTTVYQGENRFSLKNIQFLQNIIELKQKDKYFIRAYATHENAGDSYDAVVTAFKINQSIASNSDWYNAYRTLWRRNPPQGYGYGERTLELAGGRYFGDDPQGWYRNVFLDSIHKNNNLLTSWHDSVLSVVNEFSYPRPEAGTNQYDSLLQYVTSRTFTEGGSKFYDRSALYHAMGEYQFNFPWADVTVGGNFRLYVPDSRGNIFDEIDSIQVIRDDFGNEIDRKYYYLADHEPRVWRFYRSRAMANVKKAEVRGYLESR